MLFGCLLYAMKSRIYLFILFLFFLSCTGNKEKKESKIDNVTAKNVAVPAFNADSAFYFVKKQVEFGPRIPNSAAHKAAAQFFINSFKNYGAVVVEQDFEQVTFDNVHVKLKNIVASFFPKEKKRILLATHWDTRPFADHDKNKPDATFDGANDGASGVGVLLEIARQLKDVESPGVGVDIILFDGEDWGEKDYGSAALPKGLNSWWCLGSQYWARNKHVPNYSAYYGILLDMVGGKNAKFYREGFSLTYAPKVVERMWNTAERLGYSYMFVKRNQGEITDDHKFVNEIAKIPMVDIINYDPATGGFGSFHHTTDDNLDNISPATLKIVGTTLLQVVFEEGAGV